MGYRQVTRGTWWLITALAILASVAILVPSVRREVQRRRVETAIARFEANPSESTAHELDVLLANGVPTNGQGARILHLILRPAIMTRSAYPVSRIPSISIEWSFGLKWHVQTYSHYPFCLKMYVQLEGQEKPTDDLISAGILGYQPLLLRCGTRPLPVGTHHGQVCVDCTMTHLESRAPVWMRLKSLFRGQRLDGGTSREARSYKAYIEIPVAIVVTEAADAEQVSLVSAPTLEEAVRQSFTRFYHDHYPLEGIPITYKGMYCLTWKNAPIALAFEPVLRLPDGREVLHPSRHIASVGRFRTRAGDFDAVYCTRFVNQFPVIVPGQYEATIVLKADPNIAYDDPAIKAIWGGTLEFPISFSVYEVPPRR